ncbi:dihydrolipoamide acetyltransferase family protein [Paludibaculum fermentans]|uniref:dihydrolipoamide acetyltransferase family protein n=1 Tax=Paludibaculum fermentans TaxID=1473598 RepID=UPI003EBCDBBD
MTFDLVMPQLGMTMTEGTVVRWLKRVGEVVAKNEPVLEIQTDKVDMELESPQDGFLLEVTAAEGTTLPVGHLVGRIGQSMDEQPVKVAEETPVAGKGGRKVAVSPRARRIASENTVDLTVIQGTGAHGRICEADVRRFLQQQPAVPATPPPPKPDLDPARRAVAERLTTSVATIPQFWLAREVDAAALTHLRERLVPVIEARVQVRLSFTDMLLKALACCLERMPEMKQSWVNDRIETVPGCAIGFAAQAPNRLLVPALTDAAARSLSDIAVERARLTAKTMGGKLTLSDMEGACATLSNLGAFGVDEFQAIINPPQSTILAVGRIAPRAFVRDGALAVSPTLRLVLTVDHRVADGVAGARFLSLLAETLENPLSLLI